MALAGERSDTAERGLETFRDPRSITVVGASANPAKWGYWIARGALAGAHRRVVHLVNRNRAEVDGHRSVAALSEIEDRLDLVVLCTPPESVPTIVDDALVRGARGFVGITAGLDRSLDGPEHSVVRSIRDAGARIVGPNCLGLYDADTDLRLAWGHFEPGALAIVSQSGQVGLELADLAAENGVGVSRFVSVGNQADVVAHEVLTDLVRNDRTKVVALYLESFDEGRSVVDAVRALRAAGKYTVVLSVGATEASRRAAASHTGALTSAFDVIDAACRAAGAVRVDTPTQVVDVAKLLVASCKADGDRIAIVGDSGGQGAIAADRLAARSLSVEALSDVTRQQIGPMLSPNADVRNPIDLDGAGERDLNVYAGVVGALLDDDAVDAVVVTGYFGSYGCDVPLLQGLEAAVARRIADRARRAGKPVVVHSMCPASSTIDILDQQGVPVYHDVDAVATSLAAAVRLSTDRGRTIELPDPAPYDRTTGYLAARTMLVGAGVSFPPAREVCTLTEVADAAAELRSPYVLKADWVAHKTEVGGVVLGLGDLNECRSAFERLVSRIGEGRYVLEEMDSRADCVEMIVGARWDAVFGPMVLVGAGGIAAELQGDTAIELAPVDTATAVRMVRRLRNQALLDGWRGRPAVAIDQLAEVIVAVSRLSASCPDLAEIEINPLRVGPDAATAVDALATWARLDEDPYGTGM